MADKSFSDILREATERINALLKAVAEQKVRNIIENCANFKIGKTGESLEERHSQPDYAGEYEHITEIFKSQNKGSVDDMETYLISRFLLNSKCDNLKSGRASNNDTMRDNALEYRVYLVWNDKK